VPHEGRSREDSGNDTEVVVLPTDNGWVTKLTVYLPDRPGSLAHLARIAAGHDANITRFVFNRAESPNRVQLRVFVRRATQCGEYVEELKQQGLLLPPEDGVVATIPDPEAILTMKVRLVDQPGTLAAFAELLAAHNANVIFMQYDSDAAPGQVEMSMVAPSAAQAGALLNDISEGHYDFQVEYRGSDPEAYQTIIGLTSMEVFFLRLREMLPKEHYTVTCAGWCSLPTNSSAVSLDFEGKARSPKRAWRPVRSSRISSSWPPCPCASWGLILRSSPSDRYTSR